MCKIYTNSLFKDSDILLLHKINSNISVSWKFPVYKGMNIQKCTENKYEFSVYRLICSYCMRVISRVTRVQLLQRECMYACPIRPCCELILGHDPMISVWYSCVSGHVCNSESDSSYRHVTTEAAANWALLQDRLIKLPCLCFLPCLICRMHGSMQPYIHVWFIVLTNDFIGFFYGSFSPFRASALGFHHFTIWSK